MSTVLEEKTYNPRLTKSLADFIDLMRSLGLKYPRKIDIAVPANLNCGLDIDSPGPDLASGISSVSGSTSKI